MKTKTILLTGFDRFGPHRFNPTQDIAQELNGQLWNNTSFQGIVLPAIYDAFPYIKQELKTRSIQGIIALGLATSIKTIRLENRGTNKNDSPYTDNHGVNHQGEIILEKGRDYYKVNTDSKSFKLLLKENGISCEISDDAGGFVCNDLIYRTMRHITTETKKIPFCFMHIPWTDDYKEIVDLSPDKITLPKTQIITAIKLIADHMLNQ